jgi:hypothetical protein
LEKKLETEYSESRKLKESLNIGKIENEKLNQKLNGKNEEIDNCTSALRKLKVAHEILENEHKESEEDNLMLQNVVATKSKKVSDLEATVKDLSRNKYCDKCEDTLGRKYSLNEHDDNKHDEETMPTTSKSVPSTSKCGSCDFESDDAENLNVHVKSKHEFSCDICELT